MHACMRACMLSVSHSSVFPNHVLFLLPLLLEQVVVHAARSFALMAGHGGLPGALWNIVRMKYDLKFVRRDQLKEANLWRAKRAGRTCSPTNSPASLLHQTDTDLAPSLPDGHCDALDSSADAVRPDYQVELACWTRSDDLRQRLPILPSIDAFDVHTLCFVLLSVNQKCGQDGPMLCLVHCWVNYFHRAASDTMPPPQSAFGNSLARQLPLPVVPVPLPVLPVPGIPSCGTT